MGPGGDPWTRWLIDRVVALQERNAQEAERRERGRLDTRLKLEQKIVRIKGTNPETILEEIEAFEEQMRKNEVDDLRMVWRYFDLALEEGAKDWIEGVMLTEPGLTLRARTLVPNAPEQAWADLYRFARVELYRRVGLQYESPGDNAQAVWDAIHFPERASYEDVEKTLNRLNRARIRMVRAGRFYNHPVSHEREASDLRNKIPPGSELRKWRPR